jgi:hypothetical protein
MGRHHPALRANYAASDAGPECAVRPATTRDHAALFEAVTRHEGEESKRIIEAWLAHPATRAWCVCDEAGAAVGFLVALRLALSNRAAAEVAGDPLVASLLRSLGEDGRARPGAEVIIHRTMLARDDYQAPSIVTRHLHTLKFFSLLWHGAHSTALSHVVSVYGEGDIWEPAATSVGFARAPEHEVEIGKRRFTPFIASFRDEPVEAWVAKSCARVNEAIRAAKI